MTFYISPYRRMHTLRRAMDFMNAEAAPSQREMLLGVDVQASDDAYHIAALVPGLDAEDLEIEALGDTLTIRGEFRASTVEDARYLLSELPSGRFSRTITLPTEVESAEIEAAIRNGVLTLRIPKAEAHRPKPIKVVAN